MNQQQIAKVVRDILPKKSKIDGKWEYTRVIDDFAILHLPKTDVYTIAMDKKGNMYKPAILNTDQLIRLSQTVNGLIKISKELDKINGVRKPITEEYDLAELFGKTE